MTMKGVPSAETPISKTSYDVGMQNAAAARASPGIASACSHPSQGVVEDLHCDGPPEKNVLGLPRLRCGAGTEAAHEPVLSRKQIADGPGHGDAEPQATARASLT